MVATRPLFDEPAAPEFSLSEALSAFEYRLTKDEKAKWTDVRLKGYRACQECSAVQHETNGTFGPRRQVKKRRRPPHGPALELCGQHAQLWQARDEEDSSGKRR